MNLKQPILPFLLFFVAASSEAFAQFGNEWINPSQTYYQIEIGEDAIYEIEYATLSARGLPVSSINPKNIQLWRNGEEQHIFISGQSDNSFDSGDFIEFYGEYNDGELDAPLFLTADQQAHQFKSLYTDTSNYYLTWTSNTAGKRFTEFNNPSYAGKTADSWLWYTTHSTFTDEYYDGSPYFQPGYLTEYTTGEGWFSTYISGGRTANLNIATNNYNPAGPEPLLSFGVYGKSNPSQTVDGLNHKVEVSIGSDLIFEKFHSGYTRVEPGFNEAKVVLKSSQIDTQVTNIRFASTYLQMARHAVSFIKMEYPRDLDLNDVSYFEIDYTGSNDYFKFINFAGTEACIYDLRNLRRISGDVNSKTLQFNTSNVGQKKIILTSDDAKKSITIDNLKSFTTKPYDYTSTSYDYVIITHPKLAESAAEYKSYRESAKGGSHTVEIVYTPELYDHFYYGLSHPMALKNYCRLIYEQQPTKVKNILLLGKGQSYYLTRYNYLRREFENLVPTWGTPSSDYPFVTDYKENDLAPVMGIGRIPARSNQDVRNYLEKVILHEEYTNNSKVVLFLTGGVGEEEQSSFEVYQHDYNNRIKGVRFGAKGKFLAKQDASTIDQSLTAEVQEIINGGISTLGYFGHGAAQILEIDIGTPNQLDNEGKYPLFLFNGCALGNSYNDISLPEQFLLHEKTGGIAWIAGSAYGFTQPLYSWTSTFYSNMYNNHYGSSIGKLIIETIKQYQRPSDNFNRSQCRQMTYHGDPAIRMYSPEKPDYSIDENIQLYPDNANAELDSVALDISLLNYGEAVTDTPGLYLSLKYSNDSIRTFGPKYINSIFSTSEVRFWIPNNDFSQGFQTATFTIDFGDSIDEIDNVGELNNSISYEYFLPSNSLSVLAPIKDAIVPKTNVTLQVQNNSLLIPENTVVFEIDTNPNFNSPILQTVSGIKGGNIISHTFALPPFDSTDFFWRAKFDTPADASSKWVNSTFSLIYNSETGWSQGYYSKLKEATRQGVELLPNNRKLSFNRQISGRYTVYAGGINVPYYKKVLFVNGVRKFGGRYARDQVELGALNPDNLDRYIEENNPFNQVVRSRDYIAGLKYYQPGEKSGQYLYNTRVPSQLDSLTALLDRIPEGYHLLFLINGDVDIELWDEEIFTALEKFGADKIRIIKHGEPYGLLGQKGLSPGLGQEPIANYASIVPPEDQSTAGSVQYAPLLTEGGITTQNIGPSKKWKLFYRILGENDSEEDSVSYTILGVRKNNSVQTLFSDWTNKSLNLSSIDADTFPYLRINGYYKDQSKRTPSGQNRWTVLYDGVPEGSIFPSIAFEQSHDTIQEGDSLFIKVAYKNISKYDMDSVLVLTVNRLHNSEKDTIDNSYYSPLPAGDSMILSYKIHTLNQQDRNSVAITVNPAFDQPEEQLENNVLQLQYLVERDNRNPILDAVFDGVHILDFDIISPSPVITMSVLDDNQYIFIQDPEAFEVYIQLLDLAGNPTGDADTVHHTQSNVMFTAASRPGEKAILEYSPKDLASGKYRLAVRVRDASGNESSELSYVINFEVIREASITNIYPYPNPFTTSMKFVYTLTGEQVPDYMKIQIMTVTGKVVREITQDEMGLIKIGNNISQFTWNGTDEYGDQLANGVYLYKVVAKINGEDIQTRESAGDKFFTQGLGKIYLMR